MCILERMQHFYLERVYVFFQIGCSLLFSGALLLSTVCTFVAVIYSAFYCLAEHQNNMQSCMTSLHI